MPPYTYIPGTTMRRKMRGPGVEFMQLLRNMYRNLKHHYTVNIQGPQLFILDQVQRLKGLSRQIIGGIFWPAWIGLGLKRNLYWVLKFSYTPLNFCRHFKVLNISY